jgi:hypothetical protein
MVSIPEKKYLDKNIHNHLSELYSQPSFFTLKETSPLFSVRDTQGRGLHHTSLIQSFLY